MTGHPSSCRRSMGNQPRAIIIAYKYLTIVTLNRGQVKANTIHPLNMHSGNTLPSKEGEGNPQPLTSSQLASGERNMIFEQTYTTSFFPFIVKWFPSFFVIFPHIGIFHINTLVLMSLLDFSSFSSVDKREHMS